MTTNTRFPPSEPKEPRWRFYERALRPYTLAMIAMVAAGVSGVDARAFDTDAARNAIYGGLLAYGSPVSTVILGIIALMVALDGRPFVQRIKAHGHYNELVTRAWRALQAFLALIAVSFFGLLLRGQDSLKLQHATAIVALGALTTSLLQTFRLARQIMRLVRSDPQPSKATGAPVAAPPKPERGEVEREASPHLH